MDDPRRRRPDISRARELLGWRPTTGLREGLRTTLAWFGSELQRNSVSPLPENEPEPARLLVAGKA
jgi:UDP-glucuronate decarboxylase